MARHAARLAHPFAWLAFVVLTLPAQAQDEIQLETNLGTITVRLFDNINMVDFSEAFDAYYTGPPGSAVVHRSERDPCDEESCICIDYDCTDCADESTPSFLCANGLAATCTCGDDTTEPIYACDSEEGPHIECPPSETVDPNQAFCTCSDASIPAFSCDDGSTPPGSCLEFDPTSKPARALYMGLYRVDRSGEVVPVPNYIPAELQHDPGLFSNEALTLAYIRDQVTGHLTSEVVINVEDNSDLFDDASAAGANASMVVGTVIGGLNVIDALSRLPIIDISVEVDDGGMPPDVYLACTDPPPPLPSWVRGIPDAIRCDASQPWDAFPVLDLTGADPLPRINGCFPGDAACQLPICITPGSEAGCAVPACPEIALFDGVNRCTAPLLPACLDPGEPAGGLTPCLDPLCSDTFEDSGTLRCTEPLGPNFPVPEPTRAWLAAAALATLAALRRGRR